jgi:hypothetical protein
MRRLTSMAIAVSLAGFALSTGSVAAEVKAEKTPQQQRMTDCNKEAGEKKLAGDARKQFMSSCLGGKTDAKPAASTQQEKMKSCNDEAGKKSLKGDERKKFMSDCLSG